MKSVDDIVAATSDMFVRQCKYPTWFFPFFTIRHTHEDKFSTENCTQDSLMTEFKRRYDDPVITWHSKLYTQHMQLKSINFD